MRAVPVEIGPPTPDDPWVGRPSTRAKAAAAVVLVIVAAWVLLLGDESTRPGRQVPGAPVAIAAAEPDGWELLRSSGDPRPLFPEPMVRHGRRICVGFGRVDFGPTALRPSLARCVDTAAVGELPADGMVVISTVRSGNDSWHFIEVGAAVEGVEVDLGDGTRLGDERIHLGSTTVALRIPNDATVRALRWETATATYACSPPAPGFPGAGTWCAEPTTDR